MLIMVLFSAFAVIMTTFGEETIYENQFLNVQLQACNNEGCRGKGSVYRTSFVLFVFFMVHVLLVSCSLAFHYSFFIIKLFILICVVAGSFWIDNEFFDGYSIFAMYGSFLFIFIQIYVLIGWSYDFNDRITSKIAELDDNDAGNNDDIDEDESNGSCGSTCLKLLLILFTLSFNAGVITIWVYLFRWFMFNGRKECPFSNAMIISLIIICIIMTLLPIILKVGSIFVTAVVSFYVTYLVYAGLESQNDPECNIFVEDHTPPSMYIGIGITIMAICYTGFSVGSNIRENGDLKTSEDIEIEMQSKKDKKKREDSEPELNVDSNYNDVDDDDDDDDNKKILSPYQKEKRANVLFHLIMALSSIYMCMLYTGNIIYINILYIHYN